MHVEKLVDAAVVVEDQRVLDGEVGDEARAGRGEAMQRLVLKAFQSPGDIVMLTAAVRDLPKAHPNRFLTDVRTSANDLWLGSPYVTPLEDAAPGIIAVDMHCPLVHRGNERPFHFIHGYVQHLEQALDLKVPVTAFRGDIHLREDEKVLPKYALEAGVSEDFRILIAGGKHDFTAKWWNPANYQAVIDHFAGRIQFVQCGEKSYWHPELKSTLNLVGKTSIREFVRLMHGSRLGKTRWVFKRTIALVQRTPSPANVLRSALRDPSRPDTPRRQHHLLPLAQDDIGMAANSSQTHIRFPCGLEKNGRNKYDDGGREAVCL